MSNEVLLKYCSKCGQTEWVEVAIIGDREIFYFRCPNCDHVNKSKEGGEKTNIKQQDKPSHE